MSAVQDDDVSVASVDSMEGSEALSDLGVHTEEMMDILENTWWLQFCGCTGFGISRQSNPDYGEVTGGCCRPFITAQAKACCVHGICMTEDIYTNAGLFYALAKVTCCFFHFGCPPGGGDDDGIPVLAICNQRFGGEKEEGINDVMHANERIAEETFLCLYLGCIGVGVVHPVDPCCKMSLKTACVLQEWGTTDCCTDQGVFLSHYSKVACCIQACVCPPGGGKNDGIPLCGCCGNTCGGEDAGPSMKQQRMESSGRGFDRDDGR